MEPACSRPCSFTTQGTIIDRIDYNISTTAVLADEARRELVEANKSHKKYRTKLCILLLIAISVALLLTILFRPKSRGSSAGSQVAPPPTSAPSMAQPSAINVVGGTVQLVYELARAAAT